MEEITTEQKIIRAARTLFTKKGFASTRTRDIAEEAGINLALLNYYYGSKQNLFRLVMAEKIETLFGLIVPILSDSSISLQKKIVHMVEKYTELLLENQDLPIFVLNEIKNNSQPFASIVNNIRQSATEIVQKQIEESKINISADDLVVNVLSMVIFPFVSRPLLFENTPEGEQQFREFIENRRKEIPFWIEKTIAK